MKIRRLELRNFRCFKQVALDLHAPVVMVFGGNATGKSSIRDALEWCLTGRTRGTDERGAGARDLIRSGADTMGVRVFFDDDSVKVRTLSRAGTVKVDPPDAPAKRNLWRTLVNGPLFFDLDHVVAKAMLMDALDVHVEVDGRRLSLPELDTLYDAAFAARREAKATLQAIQIPPLPEGSFPTVAEIQTELEGLRTELATQERMVGRTVGRREHIEKALAKAQAKLDYERAQCVAMEFPNDLDARVTALEQDLKSRAEDYSAKLRDRKRNQFEMEQCQEYIQRLHDRPIQTVAAHQPCVLNASVPCLTPNAKFDTVLTSLRGQLEEFRVRSEATARAIQDYEQATAQLVAWRETLSLRTRFQTVAVDLMNQITDLGAELAAEPPDGADSEANAALETLRERIRKGEQILEDVRGLIRRRIEHEDKSKRAGEWATKVQALEADVEKLGPKGLRVQALEAALGEFEAAVNAGLKVFHYKVELDTSPWDVRVNGLSSDLLSTSERLRVGLAMSCALAATVGIETVMVDGADILDTTARLGLSEVIDIWRGRGGQLFLTATRDEAIPSAEGLKSYWLEPTADGTVVKVA